MKIIVNLVFYVALCYGQIYNAPINAVGKEISEKIGNFSIEVLFHTSTTLQNGQNFIMSPITVWSVLAVIAEGATGKTRDEINNALRLTLRNKDSDRAGYKNLAQWLQENTGPVTLAKVNAIFIDQNRLLLPDFQKDSKEFYQTEVVTLDFTDSVNSANVLNRAISTATNGKISNMVDPSYFEGTRMVLTSALYFKGQWSMRFNASSTERMPFFDSNGQQIGEVNMMNNRHTYPFANVRELQARALELPYGEGNRWSMIILLPNREVSIENMFYNFQNINLQTLFEKLRVSMEQHPDNEVDCFIPRFKIQSNLDLTDVLRNRLGINEMFDPARAKLPLIARFPIYASKVIHKAEIEVTEDGTEAAGVTASDFKDRMGLVKFQADRPFTYMIVEKVTNSILFGGFYRQPSLY